MVQSTEHHGWDRPEVDDDEDQWGTFLNNTIDALDAEVILKRPRSDFPDAGTADRWALATDKRTLYYDNGSTWLTIIGQEMNGAGLTELGTLADDDGNTIYDADQNHVPQARFENDTVTVAGNSVALGNSTTVDYADLDDTGGEFPVPNDDLANASLSISGIGVSLGGSMTPRQVNHEPSNVPATFPDSRPFFSDDHQDIYVDPANGDDTNGDGTSGSPYATLNRAFDDLPYWLTHEVIINLADGTYSGEPNALVAPPMRGSHIGDNGRVIIDGDTDTPSNVVLDSCDWISFSMVGTEPHDGLVLRGCEVNAKVQSYAGVIALQDCILNSSTNPGSSSVIAGYDTTAYLYNCTIGGDAEYITDMQFAGDILVRQCTGSVSEALLSTNQASSVTMHLAGNSVSAPDYTSMDGQQGIIYEDGQLIYPEVPNDTLANDSMTVAGNSVSLGDSTDIAYADLSDTGGYPIPASDLADDYALTSRFPLPNNDFQNDTVTINDTDVALGESITLDTGSGGHGAGTGLSDDGTDYNVGFAEGEILTFGGNDEWGIVSSGATGEILYFPGTVSSETVIELTGSATINFPVEAEYSGGLLVSTTATWEDGTAIRWGSADDLRQYYSTSSGEMLFYNPSDGTTPLRVPVDGASDKSIKCREGVRVGPDDRTALSDVVATGSVTLSSGTATVDTGVPTSETATFMPALGPATDDAEVAADIRSDSTSDNYMVDIQETDTDMGSPTVEYDILRVR